MTNQAQTPIMPVPHQVGRPGTLKTAIAFAVLAGTAAVLNGIVILTGGRELIMELLAGAAGLPEGSVTEADLALLEGVAGTSVADLESTLATRAYLVLAFGVLLVLSGVLMRNAAMWARTAVTLSAVGAMLFSGVIIADATTPTMALLSVIAILGAVLAAILTWLPANGRYAKAVR